KDRILTTEATRGTFVTGNDSSRFSIALVLPNLNESSSRLSAGVQEAFAASKSTVNIFHFDENPNLEIEHVRRAIADGFDGMVLFPSLDPASMKPMLQLMVDGFPIVLIDRHPASFPCWFAGADNLKGGYLATEHLIKKGCKRIACVSMGLGDVHDRYEGFLRAMGDYKLPVDFNLVTPSEHPDDPDDLGNHHVENMVDHWMSLPSPPDGIFFKNDIQAFRGIRQLLKRGFSVPDDVRVVGFDDLSLCGLSTPAITTIRQDFAAIGRAAARLLLEQIKLPKEQRFTAARRETVPVSLVPRASA
ncbi:MAG: substrate-binding domain-containing protein, partial [Opitutaceae bacterium]|nr:substrate-binding domain-containing protein [Opitutaceae bacterium]